METEKTGYGWLVILLIFIVVIGGIFGGFGGFGGNNREAHSCVSNCEVQKQEIIDSARNLYAIETQASRTIANDNANTQRLYDQSARQYEAGLQEKLFDLKINSQTTALLNDSALKAKDFEISQLKQTYALENRLNHIECNMLRKPVLYGIASTCSGEIIPSIS